MSERELASELLGDPGRFSFNLRLAPQAYLALRMHYEEGNPNNEGRSWLLGPVDVRYSSGLFVQGTEVGSG